jgi:hypothetical protein
MSCLNVSLRRKHAVTHASAPFRSLRETRSHVPRVYASLGDIRTLLRGPCRVMRSLVDALPHAEGLIPLHAPGPMPPLRSQPGVERARTERASLAAAPHADGHHARSAPPAARTPYPARHGPRRSMRGRGGRARTRTRPAPAPAPSPRAPSSPASAAQCALPPPAQSPVHRPRLRAPADGVSRVRTEEGFPVRFGTA